jgi:hypothetical protein
MGIDSRLDLGQGSGLPGSDHPVRCFVESVRAVTYDEVGGMRLVHWIVFGVMLLAMLLLSLGWAKLARHSWIWNPKQSSPL